MRLFKSRFVGLILVVLVSISFSAIVSAKKPLDSQTDIQSDKTTPLSKKSKQRKIDSSSDRHLDRKKQIDAFLGPLDGLKKKRYDMAKVHLEKVKKGLQEIANICRKTTWSAKAKLDFFNKKLAYVYKHASLGNEISVRISYAYDENGYNEYRLSTIYTQVGRFLEEEAEEQKLLTKHNIKYPPSKTAYYFKSSFLHYFRLSHNMSSPTDQEVYENAGKWLKDIADGLSCIK